MDRLADPGKVVMETYWIIQQDVSRLFLRLDSKLAFCTEGGTENGLADSCRGSGGKGLLTFAAGALLLGIGGNGFLVFALVVFGTAGSGLLAGGGGR